MNILLIKKDDYLKVFPRIESYLESAAEYTYGRFKAQDIKDRLLKSDQKLWIAFEDETIYGFVVTEVLMYPQIKTLVMHFTAGKELPKWKDAMLKELKRFAKDFNCSIIESYGRRGWSKVFKNDGYKEQFTFYELPVEN